LRNSSKRKVIPIHSAWAFSLDSKSTLRLHDHGLLRVFKIQIDKKSKEFNPYTFFTSLIDSNFYQELFFDHFSQISDGKHGPFLTENISPGNFSEEKNKVLTENISPGNFSEEKNKGFKEKFLKIVTSPKWGCPKISGDAFEKIKLLQDHVVTDRTLIYFLDKCRTFNTSSNEAKIYEHEWSHNLSSFYEFILYDPEVKTGHILILTYE